MTSPLSIFSIATVLGVLTGLQAYNYVALTAEHKQPFNVLLALNLTYWWSWALLVPGVLWMVRHYRFERNRWRRQVFVHVLGVVVFTGLTAYVAQRLKAMALAMPEGQAGSYAIVGALALYLDFVNLFLMLLRLFGGRRR